MCNFYDHSNNGKKIEKEGKGWKIFVVGDINGRLRRANTSHLYKQDGKWIIWKDRCGQGDGFCFFLDKKEAERVLELCIKNWRTYIPGKFVLKEIEYQDGIGECNEYYMFDSYITVRKAICKAFKVV
jgi:hypothetical protein